MAEYNNAAGRLLAIFERFLAKNNQHLPRPDFAGILGCQSDWTSILSGVADLRREFEILGIEIEQYRDNPAKYQLYRNNLPAIEKSINSIQLMIQNDMGQGSVTESATVALRFIAADMVQDESPEDDTIRRLQSLVNELQSEIQAATEFKGVMREWLLDIVRVLRDSIDRFAIRGSRGAKEQACRILGELMSHYDFVEKVKKEKPSIWTHVAEAVDRLNDLAALAEKYRPTLTFARKFLPRFLAIESSASDDDPASGELDN